MCVLVVCACSWLCVFTARVPGVCTFLVCAHSWCVCVTGLCMSLVCVCPWCVRVPDVCMLVVSVLLVYACPWRVRVLDCVCCWSMHVCGACVSLACACPWCVCVTHLCMSLVCACPGCVRVQAVCGPMCVAGEGLPSVTWMPHCWGLCTHPAPLLPHGRGLPVSFLTSCFPGGHRTILRVLPLPSLGAGGRQENTGAGFEGGKGASDWTSVKLGSIWAQRVLRPERLGHTGKWTPCPCIAAHCSVTGAHGVGSRGRAGGSLSVSGGSLPCTVPMAAFPPGRLASSHSGAWQDPIPGGCRTEAPGPHRCQPGVVLRFQRPLCSSGPGPALSGGRVLLLLWVPDLPSCLLVCLGASCDDWVPPDNPGHSPHLNVSSLVTIISKVPHSGAQVRVWWVTGVLGRHNRALFATLSRSRKLYRFSFILEKSIYHF